MRRPGSQDHPPPAHPRQSIAHHTRAEASSLQPRRPLGHGQQAAGSHRSGPSLAQGHRAMPATYAHIPGQGVAPNPASRDGRKSQSVQRGTGRASTLLRHPMQGSEGVPLASTPIRPRTRFMSTGDPDADEVARSPLLQTRTPDSDPSLDPVYYQGSGSESDQQVDRAHRSNSDHFHGPGLLGHTSRRRTNPNFQSHLKTRSHGASNPYSSTFSRTHYAPNRHRRRHTERTRPDIFRIPTSARQQSITGACFFLIFLFIFILLRRIFSRTKPAVEDIDPHNPQGTVSSQSKVWAAQESSSDYYVPQNDAYHDSYSDTAGSFSSFDHDGEPTETLHYEDGSSELESQDEAAYPSWTDVLACLQPNSPPLHLLELEYLRDSLPQDPDSLVAVVKEVEAVLLPWLMHRPSAWTGVRRGYVAAGGHNWSNIQRQVEVELGRQLPLAAGDPIHTSDERYAPYSTETKRKENVEEIKDDGWRFGQLLALLPTRPSELPDYSLSIVPSITSPSLRGANGPEAWPQTALNGEYECWAVPEEGGQLGILLSHPVVVSSFTVEHPSRLVSPEAARSAPQEVQLWGMLMRPEHAHAYERERWRLPSRISTNAEVSEGPAGYMFLGSGKYDVGQGVSQRFMVPEVIQNLKLPSRLVRFVLPSKRGEHICLYRVKVNGLEAFEYNLF